MGHGNMRLGGAMGMGGMWMGDMWMGDMWIWGAWGHHMRGATLGLCIMAVIRAYGCCEGKQGPQSLRVGASGAAAKGPKAKLSSATVTCIRRQPHNWGGWQE